MSLGQAAPAGSSQGGGCAVRLMANGRYLSADYYITNPGDPQFGLVRARATAIGGWETFRMHQW